MNKDVKIAPHFPLFYRKMRVNLLIILLIFSFLGGGFGLKMSQPAEADFEKALEKKSALIEAVIIQENSLLPFYSPLSSEEKFKTMEKIEVIVTGYSSSPWETDGDPYLTASGAPVGDGVVATNILPFGTKIKFPELFGDKVFVVKDRMNSRANYQADIWFPYRQQALNFGAKRTHLEIIQEG